MTLRSAIRAQGGGRKRGCPEGWCLSSQVTIKRDEALLSWKWLNISLLMGSSEGSPYFSSLECTAFSLPI